MKRLILCAAASWQIVAGAAHAQAPAAGGIALDPAAKQAVEGINSFTVDLYKRSIEPGVNMFISPASVSTAVGLAYRGARGTTADELRKALHFGAPPAAYIAANGELLKALPIHEENQELNVANALWVQQGLPLLPDFTADLARHVGAGLERVDYRTNPEAARRRINQWVEKSTHNRVQELLHPGDVTANSGVTLVNALYWKGAWAHPFQVRNTQSLLFNLLDGTKVDTPLMSQQAKYQVSERDGVKAIQLPYESGRVSMVVLLPNGATDLPKLEAELTASGLGRWIAELDAAKLRDTILTLPKMHVEWRNDLVGTLKQMGAKTAFTSKADFSGMTKPGAPRVTIASIIHQTWLDVDEKGSEAAAATAVGMRIASARPQKPQPPFVFRADKPFLFLLRDRATGVILFIGRFIAPPSE